jgi:hypothetical protein
MIRDITTAQTHEQKNEWSTPEKKGIERKKPKDTKWKRKHAGQSAACIPNPNTYTAWQQGTSGTKEFLTGPLHTAEARGA